MKRVVAAAAALGFGVGLVLAVEGVLALAGVRPLSREDLFAGFERSLPLFEPRERRGAATVYALNPAKQQHFNPQEFLMPKPPAVFRIISFGGSTTYGRPYINTTSFPAWTARLLGHLDPSRTYESINAGGISYASYRVRRLMDELAQFSPDLYVLYSGHNEFLESRTFGAVRGEPPALRRLRSVLHGSRIYTLLYRAVERARPRPSGAGNELLAGEVEALLDSVGPQAYHRDPEFRAGVIDQYGRNLRLMAAFCRERRLPLVICTLPSNLSGFSPFKSEHRDGLGPAELARWEAAFAEGEGLLSQRQFAAALGAFAAAEGIDDRYAQLHYLKGKALEGLGRWDEAYAAYMRAKEEDIVPLRALEVFNQEIRETARESGIPLVDVEALFRGLSPHGIPGSNLFTDHVHPTLEGFQIIARAVVDTAVRAGMVPLDLPTWEQRREEATDWLAAELAMIPERYRAMGYWGVGREVIWGGKREEAYVAFREAWKTVRDVPDLGYKLGMLEAERGNAAEAAAVLEETLAVEPENPDIRMALGEARLMLGDLTRAAPLIEGLAGALEDTPRFRLARAEVRRLQGKTGETLVDLAAAERLAPEDPLVREAIAKAYLRLGDVAAAEQHYRQYLVLARAPDPLRALEDWKRSLNLPVAPVVAPGTGVGR